MASSAVQYGSQGAAAPAVPSQAHGETSSHSHAAVSVHEQPTARAAIKTEKTQAAPASVHATQHKLSSSQGPSLPARANSAGQISAKPVAGGSLQCPRPAGRPSATHLQHTVPSAGHSTPTGPIAGKYVPHQPPPGSASGLASKTTTGPAIVSSSSRRIQSSHVPAPPTGFQPRPNPQWLGLPNGSHMSNGQAARSASDPPTTASQRHSARSMAGHASQPSGSSYPLNPQPTVHQGPSQPNSLNITPAGEPGPAPTAEAAVGIVKAGAVPVICNSNRGLYLLERRHMACTCTTCSSSAEKSGLPYHELELSYFERHSGEDGTHVPVLKQSVSSLYSGAGRCWW